MIHSLNLPKFSLSHICIIIATAYSKTFEWKNFRDWYANDHLRENFCGCLTLSRHVLHEAYRITYKNSWENIRD